MTEGVPAMRIRIETGPDGKPYVARTEDLGVIPEIDLDDWQKGLITWLDENGRVSGGEDK
jgi:hypothetical protein